MGLDQYLYKIKTTKNLEKVKKELDDLYVKGRNLCKEYEEEIEFDRIGYWRKEQDLDDFMYIFYRGNGDFNCEWLEITEDIISQLKEQDFYVGTTVEIFNKAEDLLNKGYRIIYTNWW